MALPCPSVNEAIAYVQHNMHPRFNATLPMCEIISARQTADVYGLRGHDYLVEVTARYIDRSGAARVVLWQVYHELAGGRLLLRAGRK